MNIHLLFLLNESKSLSDDDKSFPFKYIYLSKKMKWVEESSLKGYIL